jgi:hypothetical protein
MNRSIARKVIAVLTVALVCGAVAAEAAIRIEVPEQGPGIPAYATINGQPLSIRPWVIQDGTWAAIAFYRLPECVPRDFNLLSFFDIPRAFACPLTVRGFEIWKNGLPPVDFAPIQNELRGLGAVPVWFVRWSELQGAIADGTLTITELWTIPSLRIGTASFFQLSIQPVGAPATRGSLQIVAHGLLSNGTSFQLEVASPDQDSISSVKISFR